MFSTATPGCCPVFHWNILTHYIKLPFLYFNGSQVLQIKAAPAAKQRQPLCNRCKWRNIQIHRHFLVFVQVFSLIWIQLSWKGSLRKVLEAPSCSHQYLRCPLLSWSPFPHLRFHLPRVSRKRRQTPAPWRSQKLQRLQTVLVRAPSPAAEWTAPTGRHKQMRTKSPRRAKLISTALFVKSQSTPSHNWRRTTVVRTTALPFYQFLTFGIYLTLNSLSLFDRYKAQNDVGRSQCSAPAQGQSGGSSSRLQEQASGQQRQRRAAQQELPVWSLRDICELWDPAESGRVMQACQISYTVKEKKQVTGIQIGHCGNTLNLQIRATVSYSEQLKRLPSERSGRTIPKELTVLGLLLLRMKDEEGMKLGLGGSPSDLSRPTKQVCLIWSDFTLKGMKVMLIVQWEALQSNHARRRRKCCS